MRDQQSHHSDDGQHFTRRRALQGATVAVGVVLAGTAVWSFRQSSDAPLADVDAQMLAWPKEDRWPGLFDNASAEVLDLYRYAAANQELLKWLPCFCGCVEQGHTSNFDCFVKQVRGDGSVILDTMSFTWGVCQDVARAAMTLRPEGKSLREIRDYVDETYGDIGPATNTPYPPEGI